MTSGSVDDGKSTLIGRLLHDSKAIFDDQYADLETTGLPLNLALLTDGLKAEREQGITIDVAYRFFSTPARKFVVVDAPGHAQFTRNMVTGASHVDIALVLVDATQGILEQTRRHSYIAELLHLQHIVVCINKMDLVDYSSDVFARICQSYRDQILLDKSYSISFIPLCALSGDNVVLKSQKMPWFQGASLLQFLEEYELKPDNNDSYFKMPIQNALDIENKPQIATGQVATGKIQVGDEVILLPSKQKTRIKSIYHQMLKVDSAEQNQAIALDICPAVKLQRGELIVSSASNSVASLVSSARITAKIVWMLEQPLTEGSHWKILTAGQELECVIDKILSKVDVNSGKKEQTCTELLLNDIGEVVINLPRPIYYMLFAKSKTLGSAILVGANETAAALMFT